MNISACKKFMNSNKKQIIDLFMYYQMIEMSLFVRLYFPDIPENDREDSLKKLEKEINSKTLGKMKKKYLSKFPDDKYKLKSIIEVVSNERNTFMHSLWISLALMKKEDSIKNGKIFFNQYEKNAVELFDGIHKMPI
jgi:hypothetical protein